MESQPQNQLNRDMNACAIICLGRAEIRKRTSLNNGAIATHTVIDPNAAAASSGARHPLKGQDAICSPSIGLLASEVTTPVRYALALLFHAFLATCLNWEHYFHLQLRPTPNTTIVL